jgi:hypothetical protein
MTQQRDIERILDRWLADGPTEAPDRVFDVVADRIERQAQRPAWRLRLKESPVNGYLKPILAIAAVIVVAFVGYNLLPAGTGGPGSQPSPSPSSSFSVVCKEGATACAGPLAAGEHSSVDFQPALTFTVPEGWANTSDKARAYDLEGLTAAPFPQLAVMSQTAIPEQTESCEPTKKAGAGNSVEDWMDFLTNHPGLEVSDPVPVDFGGHKGQSVQVRLASTWTQLCPYIGNSSPFAVLITDSAATPTRIRGLEAVDTNYLTIVDVDGETVIIYLPGPADPEVMDKVIAAAQPVIDSMRFTPGG